MEQNVAGLTVSELLWIKFERNKKQILWGTIIVLILGVAVGYYVWSKNEKEVNAGVALSAAAASSLGPGTQSEPVEAYLKIAADHPGTGAGAQALLHAATGLFGQGKYTEAQSQFKKLIADYPNNAFRPQAMLGVAACYDATGNRNEAARAYQEVIDRHSQDTVVLLQAKLGLARIHESQNKFKEAFDLYEQVARTQPFNSFVREAMIKLEEFRSKQPATATAPVPPTTPAPATTGPSAPADAPAFPMLSTPGKTNAPAAPPKP